MLSAMAACGLTVNCAMAEGTIVYGDSYQPATNGGDNQAEFEAALKDNPCPVEQIAAEPGTYTFEAKGELGVTKGEGTIALRFDVDQPIYNISSASVEINAYDVDYPIDYSNPEHDVVYFNGKKVGRLTGVNNGWRKNTFSVNGSLIKVPSASGEKASNSLDIHVDIGDGDWITQIGQAILTVRGDKYLFDAPKNLEASDYGTKPHPLGILVSWNKVSGAESYSVYLDDKRIAVVESCEYLDLPKSIQDRKFGYYHVCVSSKTGLQLSPASEKDYGEWKAGESPNILNVVPTYPNRKYRAGDTLMLDVELNKFDVNVYQIEEVFVTASRMKPNRPCTYSSQKNGGFGKTSDGKYRVAVRIPDDDAHGEFTAIATIKYKRTGDDSTFSNENGAPLTFRVFFDTRDDDGKRFPSQKVHPKNCRVPNWAKYWRRSTDNVVPEFTDDIFFNDNLRANNKGVTYGQFVAGKEQFFWYDDGWQTGIREKQSVSVGKGLAGAVEERILGLCFYGADTVANTVKHENGHKKLYLERNGIMGEDVVRGKKSWKRWKEKHDTDGDGLSDSKETALGGKHTATSGYVNYSVTNPDSFGIAGIQGYPAYREYGDEESYVRFEAANATANNDNDWSISGVNYSKGSFDGSTESVSSDLSLGADNYANYADDPDEKSGLCSELPLPIIDASEYDFSPDFAVSNMHFFAVSNKNGHVESLRICCDLTSKVTNDILVTGYIGDTSGKPIAYASHHITTSNGLQYLTLSFDSDLMFNRGNGCKFIGFVLETAFDDNTYVLFEQK